MNFITRCVLFAFLSVLSLQLEGQLEEGVDFEVGVLDLNTNLSSAREPYQIVESENGAFILYDRFLQDRENELFYFDGSNWSSILEDVTEEMELIQAFQNGMIVEIYTTRYEYWLVDEDDFSKTLLHQSNWRVYSEWIQFDDELIFKGADSLYITDGTTDGTRLLSPELEEFQRENSITILSDSLFVFFGDEKVYKSDGTSEGTSVIFEEKFSIDYSYGLYDMNNRIIFKDWYELMSCDLSGNCDTLLTPPEGDWFSYGEPVRLGEQLLLPVSSNLLGGEWWRSDGTVEGSYLIADLFPGDESGRISSPENGYPVYSGRVYFYGRNGETNGVFSLDGSPDGITLETDLSEFPNRTVDLITLQLLGSSRDESQVYFQTNMTNEEQHEIWGIGGSAGRTPVFTGTLPGYSNTVENVASGNEGIYFSQTDFNTPLDHEVVYGLSDPSGPIHAIDSFDWVPEFWIEEVGRLYFRGRPIDGPNEVALRSAELDDQVAKSYQGVFPMSSYFTVGDETYFINDDSIVNESVYRLNASEDSPEILIDIFPNNDGSGTKSVIKKGELFYVLRWGDILATTGNDDFVTIYSGDLSWLNVLAETDTKILFDVNEDNYLLTDGTVEGTLLISPPGGSRFNRSSYSSFKEDIYYTTTEIFDNQQTKQSLIRFDVETISSDTVYSTFYDQPIYESNLQIAATEDNLFFSESYERTDGRNRSFIKVYDGDDVINLPNSDFEDVYFLSFLEGQMYSIGNAIIIEKFNGDSSSVYLIQEDLSSSNLIWGERFFTPPKFSFIDDEAIYGVKSRQLLKSLLSNATEAELLIHSEDVSYGPYGFNDDIFIYFTKQNGGDYQLRVNDGELVEPVQGGVFLDQDTPSWSIYEGSVMFLRHDSLFSFSITSGSTTAYTFPLSQLTNFDLIPVINNKIYCTADNTLLGNEIHYLDFNLTQTTTGTTYHDANQNNELDPEEKRLNNLPVIAEGSTSRIVFSDQEGQYAHYLRIDQDYTVTAAPDQCWELSTTPDRYSITANQDSVYTLNFGFQPIDGAANIRPLLTMARPRCGFTIPAWITLFNDGCEDLDYTSAMLRLPEGVSLISANLPPVNTGDLISWEPGPLATGESHVIYLELKMPGEEANGEDIIVELMSTGIYEFDLAIESDFTFNQPLSCAIDPNDKQVMPSRAEPSNSNYTQNDETLTYTIRFQNTGTDTAFNVRLEDQLSENLDHLSFRPLAASHPYRASMDEKGLVKVFFDNIMLPDSNVNQALSNGFFIFDVNALPELEDFSSVDNTVGIFFDFNQPVITNTVTNTIVEFLDEDEDGFLFYEECDDKNPNIRPDAEEIPGNGIDENCDNSDFPVSTLSPLSGQLSVFPNPAHLQVYLTFSDNRELLVQLYDLLGRAHRQQTFRRNGSLSLNNLPAGTYLLRVTDVQNGESNIQKIVHQ